jgi:HPt (histidine-containing phosphotransfer) domain-containing protein
LGLTISTRLAAMMGGQIWVESADGPAQLAAARDAIAQQDAEGLNRCSHILKATLGNFCAADAFQAAHQLEILGTEHNLNGAEESYAVLERAIHELQAELTSLVRGNEQDRKFGNSTNFDNRSATVSNHA